MENISCPKIELILDGSKSERSELFMRTKPESDEVLSDSLFFSPSSQLIESEIIPVGTQLH